MRKILTIIVTITLACAVIAKPSLTFCSKQSLSNIQVAHGFLNWLKKHRNEHNPNVTSELPKYFNKDAYFTMNSKFQANSLIGIQAIFHTTVKGVAAGNYHFDDIIAADDKVVMYYHTYLSFNGVEQPLTFVDVFTFKNGKIQTWNESYAGSDPIF